MKSGLLYQAWPRRRELAIRYKLSEASFHTGVSNEVYVTPDGSIDGDIPSEVPVTPMSER